MKGVRYKKSGWFGESHRHYLASKGIKTRNRVLLKKWKMPGSAEVFVEKSTGKVVAAYDVKSGVGEAIPDAELRKANKKGIIKAKKGKYFAYKGFTPDEVQLVERIFEENPRMKFKRDRSVKNIEKTSSFETESALASTDTGVKKKPIITLSDDAFKDEGTLKKALAHELVHSSESVKNPELFEVVADVPALVEKEGFSRTSEFAAPDEYHAYTQTDPERRKQYAKIFNKQTPKSKFVRGTILKYNEELQKSPNLRDLPEVWEK